MPPSKKRLSESDRLRKTRTDGPIERPAAAGAPGTLMNELTVRLSAAGSFQSCALLDYPDHLNLGDHLIWLGTLIYLHARQSKIKYAASLVDYSRSALNNADPEVIFFQGGGNFGDLWNDSQLFRERVINESKGRKVVILPQSICFRDEKNLRRAQSVLNSHGDVTIFLRDRESFDFAERSFPDCHCHLAPDMAFMLASLDLGKFKSPGSNDLLLLRDDAEGTELAEKMESETGFHRQDWCSYSWLYDGRGKTRSYNSWCHKLPGAVWAAREIWQRRLSRPGSIADRIRFTREGRRSGFLAGTTYDAANAFSWSTAFDAIRQIASARRLITNRLHAHILAVLLNKRHILLPNAYHKNKAFYDTWTEQTQSAAFANDEEELKKALTNLYG